MRLYSFTNMYISPIQCGIQTAHIVSELSTDTKNPEMYRIWAQTHKTIIVLNGGYASTMNNLFEKFLDPRNTFPCAKFEESEDALSGALTAVGIILPERVYAGDPTNLCLSTWERELQSNIQEFKLA